MKVITADFETYWSVTHSLSKMSPLKYVMHHETEVMSLGLKVNDGKTVVVFGEDKIAALLARIDWSDVLLVAHNMSGFDAMVFAWRFNVHPKMWACTLAMARPKHAKTTGLSLAKLVEHYGLGVKDQKVLHDTKGRHLCDFTPEELRRMAKYNGDDVDQCYDLFKVLLKITPPAEMQLIDMTIRMLVEPEFELDTDLLEMTLAEERQRKVEMLAKVAQTLGANSSEEVRATLASATKFKALLESLGVECPMKPSPTNPEKMVPALAKTDEAFTDLQEHENPLVAAAAASRLGVRSTILESRITALLEAGEVCDGLLPVPLNYAGADTTIRWSGWLYNMQNLPSIRGAAKPSDALRYSVRAPAGYKIIAVDSSGIELRVNMFLWKVPYATELLTADPENADLYKVQAAESYGVEVDEVSKDQRQYGKVQHLACGFGIGGAGFQKAARVMGGLALDLDRSTTAVKQYRTLHPEIVAGWKRCHKGLDYIRAGEEFDIDPWGLCRTSHEGILVPNGIIRYPDLRNETDGGKTEWFYGQGRHKARIYAGKIDENIVQRLARDVVAEQALSIKKESGKRMKLMVHDELVYVIPDSETKDFLDLAHRHMRTPPKWWPDLAVWAKGDVAQRYGEAK